MFSRQRISNSYKTNQERKASRRNAHTYPSLQLFESKLNKHAHTERKREKSSVHLHLLLLLLLLLMLLLLLWLLFLLFLLLLGFVILVVGEHLFVVILTTATSRVVASAAKATTAASAIHASIAWNIVVVSTVALVVLLSFRFDIQTDVLKVHVLRFDNSLGNLGILEDDETVTLNEKATLRHTAEQLDRQTFLLS